VAPEPAPKPAVRVPLSAGFVVLWLAALLLLAPTARAQSGGIQTFAGETLFAQGTRVSLTSFLERKGTLRAGSGSLADPTHRRLTEQREVLGIDHGLLRNLTFTVLLPRVSRRMTSTGATQRSTGLGDVALMTKWRFMHQTRERGATHLSLVTGVEAPTGETRERDNGALLPPGLQPGSGSWNPFAAVVLTSSQGLWRFDASVFHQLKRTGSQHYNQGDVTVLEAAVAYRFLHQRYPGHAASARLGLQWRRKGRDRAAGGAVLASGSEELFLRSGIGWHPTPAWDVSFSYDVPLRQDVRAVQLATDSRLRLAVGLRF
jgi:hypothetical protein